MLFFSLLTSLILLNPILISSAPDISNQRENIIDLEHLLDNNFTVRSKYIIKTKADGNQEINTIESDKNGIKSNEVNDFKNLLIDNSLYRIRMITRSNDGHILSSVTGAIPVCDLQKSGFKEDIALHLDNNGSIIGLSYSSPVMAISKPCDSSKVKIFSSRLVEILVVS